MQSARRAAVEDGDDCLLTETQVEKEFGIGVRILRDMRHRDEGEGPPVTVIGSRLKRYRRGSVRQWVWQQEGGGAGQGREIHAPHGPLIGALKDREAMTRAAMGAAYYRGSVALRHALALRMAPALERIFYCESEEIGCFAVPTLAVVPFPAAALGCGDGVDLSDYLAAADDLATRSGGLIVAEPGHDWRRLIEDWQYLAPFLKAPPMWVTAYRADRLLAVEGSTARAAGLAAGDRLERELSDAARAVGLPFHSETPGDAGGIVADASAKREAAKAAG